MLKSEKAALSVTFKDERRNVTSKIPGGFPLLTPHSPEKPNSIPELKFCEIQNTNETFTFSTKFSLTSFFNLLLRLLLALKRR